MRILVASSLVLVAWVGVTGCVGAPDELRDELDPVPLTVMTYNLANAVDGRAELLAERVAEQMPDLVAVQECLECQDFVARLPGGYQLAAEELVGVAVIYDSQRWLLLDQDVFTLGVDDDLWGRRVASWARLEHRETRRRQLLFSTHWCVSVRAAGDACDDSRQNQYAETILEQAECLESPRTPAIVAGDLNNFDGDSAPALRTFAEAEFTDVFRSVYSAEAGLTFEGNDWAPPARLDYVFASGPVEVLDATVDSEFVGSDHLPVTATLLFAAD